jgi:hypothetical protein
MRGRSVPAWSVTSSARKATVQRQRDELAHVERGAARCVVALTEQLLDSRQYGLARRASRRSTPVQREARGLGGE